MAHLTFARAAFEYPGTGGALARRLKFARDRGAGRILARAMADSVRGWARGRGRRALLVPIPLHRRKRRRRGIDQAAVLAVGIAADLRLPVVPSALRRVRDTLPQGDVRVTDRAANIAGAFVVARPRAVRGRTVLLVDDVFTSGSTVRECARLLRLAGAARVALITACRSRH